MKLLYAFLRLARWPNLAFIALSQFLFRYCIVEPVWQSGGLRPLLSWPLWAVLCASSLLITAAGYMINDYFDLTVDRINRPRKNLVEKQIKRRPVIAWHLLLSLAGIAGGVYIDLQSPVRFLGLINAGCVLLLFAYSVSLKKKLLAGNVLIALLTAWSVLVISYAEAGHFLAHRGTPAVEKLSRLTVLYGGFAFIIALVREVFKDLEHRTGDVRFGYSTMPIRWGIQVSKVFAAVWITVLAAVLLIIQVYVLQFGMYVSAAYCVFTIILPLLMLLRRLFAAYTVADFDRLNGLVKLIMLAGILSMVFFRIYA